MFKWLKMHSSVMWTCESLVWHFCFYVFSLISSFLSILRPINGDKCGQALISRSVWMWFRHFSHRKRLNSQLTTLFFSFLAFLHRRTQCANERFVNFFHLSSFIIYHCIGSLEWSAIHELIVFEWRAIFISRLSLINCHPKRRNFRKKFKEIHF